MHFPLSRPSFFLQTPPRHHRISLLRLGAALGLAVAAGLSSPPCSFAASRPSRPLLSHLNRGCDPESLSPMASPRVSTPTRAACTWYSLRFYSDPEGTSLLGVAVLPREKELVLDASEWKLLARFARQMGRSQVFWQVVGVGPGRVDHSPLVPLSLEADFPVLGPGSLSVIAFPTPILPPSRPPSSS